MTRRRAAFGGRTGGTFLNPSGTFFGGRTNRWYRQAAEKGHAEGMFTLATMYLTGKGQPKNPQEGRKWLEKAADLGNQSATIKLARLKS